MTPNKPMHFKQIIEFILKHDKQYSRKELRKIFDTDLPKFIILLDDAVQTSGVMPGVAMPFYKDIMQEHKPNQAEDLTMQERNLTDQVSQEIESEPKSLYEIAMARVVAMFNRIKLYVTSNLGKAKGIGAAVAALAIGYFAKAHTGLFLALAAIKGGSAVSTIKSVGITLLSKAIDIKDTCVDKLKGAVTWVRSLFTSLTTNFA